MKTWRVVLAGTRGYGRLHLENLGRLAALGRVEIVGLADPAGPEPEALALAPNAVHRPDLPGLLEVCEPDVTVVSTPIHTHHRLAVEALEAGSHVLLEKPPTSTLASYDALVELATRERRAVQVGFQSLGSHALDHVTRLVRQGAIGEVRGIGAGGAWIRTDSYFARSSWAGQRSLGGVPVVDGALTNPFAHATATALSLDGSDHRGQLRQLEVELYRANPIAADDTSSLRLVTERGTPVVVAVTLCARHETDPYVLIDGSEGSVRFDYPRHRVELDRGGHVEHFEHGATDLVEDLLDHLDGERAGLRSPLEASGAFMEVLEAVRLAPDPAPIDATHTETITDADGAHRRIIRGVDDAVAAAVRQRAMFSELGVPWALATVG